MFGMDVPGSMSSGDDGDLHATIRSPGSPSIATPSWTAEATSHHTVSSTTPLQPQVDSYDHAYAAQLDRELNGSHSPNAYSTARGVTFRTAAGSSSAAHSYFPEQDHPSLEAAHSHYAPHNDYGNVQGNDNAPLVSELAASFSLGGLTLEEWTTLAGAQDTSWTPTFGPFNGRTDMPVQGPAEHLAYGDDQVDTPPVAGEANYAYQNESAPTPIVHPAAGNFYQGHLTSPTEQNSTTFGYQDVVALTPAVHFVPDNLQGYIPPPTVQHATAVSQEYFPLLNSSLIHGNQNVFGQAPTARPETGYDGHQNASAPTPTVQTAYTEVVRVPVEVSHVAMATSDYQQDQEFVLASGLSPGLWEFFQNLIPFLSGPQRQWALQALQVPQSHPAQPQETSQTQRAPLSTVPALDSAPTAGNNGGSTPGSIGTNDEGKEATAAPPKKKQKAKLTRKELSERIQYVEGPRDATGNAPFVDFEETLRRDAERGRRICLGCSTSYDSDTTKHKPGSSACQKQRARNEKAVREKGQLNFFPAAGRPSGRRDKAPRKRAECDDADGKIAPNKAAGKRKATEDRDDHSSDDPEAKRKRDDKGKGKEKE